MIGQTRVIQLAKLGIKSGKNLLITGPSGHGKSMLAREVITYNYIELGEPEPPWDILDYPQWNIPSRAIICDEIHLTKGGGLWPLFLDNYHGVVCFTTTNPEKVVDAIKTRSLIIELEEYTIDQLITISGVETPEIAELCRGIPRRAKNLGDLFRSFEGSMEEFMDLLDMTEFNGYLVFPEELKYLTQLFTGCKSENVLKSVLNLGNFAEVELGLLRLGLIEVTREGRCLKNLSW